MLLSRSYEAETLSYRRDLVAQIIRCLSDLHHGGGRLCPYLVNLGLVESVEDSADDLRTRRRIWACSEVVTCSEILRSADFRSAATLQYLRHEQIDWERATRLLPGPPIRRERVGRPSR